MKCLQTRAHKRKVVDRMEPIWFKPMEAWPQFQKLKKAVRTAKGITLINGMSEVQKCHFLASLLYPPDRTGILITYDEMQAGQLLDDMEFFFPGQAVLFPPREIMLYHTAARSREIMGQRISVMERLAAGEKLMVVAPVDSLLVPDIPPDVFRQSQFQVTEGEECSPGQLSRKAVQMGYERTSTVEGPGQFSLRGSIFDIYPLSSEKPFRIDFFDEFVDSIRSFDPVSQRSEERVEMVTVSPATDLILDDERREKGRKKTEQSFRRQMQKMRKDPKFDAGRLENRMDQFFEDMDQGVTTDQLVNFFPFYYEKFANLLDYAGVDAALILDEPVRILEHCRTAYGEFSGHFSDLLLQGEVLPEQSRIYGEYENLLADADAMHSIAMQSLPRSSLDFEPKRIQMVSSRTIPSYHGKLELMAEDIRYWKGNHDSILLLSGNRLRAESLASSLLDYGLETVVCPKIEGDILPGQIVIVPKSLRKGFEYPEGHFVLVSDQEIYGVRREKAPAGKKKKKLDPFTDLKVGSYVVHENHGIGRYLGIKKMTVNGQERDYLDVRYAGTDRLYIPTDQMDLIQPYVGMEDRHPRLSRLGGSEWQRTKTRVQESVKKLAFDLLKLYAAREATVGFAFSADNPWQRQFEESFPYELTPDQLQSLEEIKRDMESKRVMDRLLCGDVGYGKTEVAIRAAFKAVMDGKQVAVLAPTTILAQQHYGTFVSRFGDFPFTVQVLSRFRKPGEQKAIRKELREGNVDVIIGTHRLLSKDVKFRDLGLLIVDEEQRFGVGHKETIKQMKKNVDVLTLTATPIPRTLHMSMVGIRDISVIETPPEGRFPVQTYVTEYNDSLIRDAIVREIQRGGQVYFVYNHVKRMERMAQRLRQLVPEARVAVAHGQMNEASLERIMVSFYEHESDLLLCSTIIENGLDIPNVNTLIVYDSDCFGLSQLYQLRGRVGRSHRIAYAYFTYQKDKILNESAEKRLQAVKEFTEFGAGFKIAMRDLEIRGAGNLLGAEQHGQMAAVGYDMYCKLLSETVQGLKGEEPPKQPETVVNVKADAYIDNSYISEENHKIRMYKRIAAIGSLSDKNDVEDEMTDRFGDIPVPTHNLIRIAYIRALAGSLRMTEISQRGREVRMKLQDSSALAPRTIMILLNENRRVLQLGSSQPPVFRLRVKEGAGPETLEAVQNVLERLKDLQQSESHG